MTIETSQPQAPSSRVGCARGGSRLRLAGPGLAALLAAAALANRAGAQLPDWKANDVHRYADRAACEMGAREDAYLPTGITPDLATEIPITWNERRVRWKPTDLRTGTGQFQYLDDKGAWQSITAGAPEAGANGPFTDPAATRPALGRAKWIKCDHYPYIEPSCAPGQKILEKVQGGIRWQILSRRKTDRHRRGPAAVPGERHRCPVCAPTPTATPSPTATATDTATRTHTPTSSASHTPTPTPASTPTDTPSATATPATGRPAPSATASAVDTPDASPTVDATGTVPPPLTETAGPALTATADLSADATPTASAVPTEASSLTPSATPEDTALPEQRRDVT